MDGVIGCADLRPFVQVKKVGHKLKHALLALGSCSATMGACYGAHVIYQGMRKWCDIDGGQIHGGGRTGDANW